ncbi:MFS transporter [Aspergillus clavatus NRRL 1]|uniref:MFS transporter, putative n=1 Tax=Aspergillus clavatus (strain ATCC 1007 / CBS 513.65 / DSM 816 / NCTC 3887 / NRRL 1 / QM 1276 / 107) TaxID=344612 RepID=A1C3V5_ASPCL|nr:MFS transporter, putative [Aspergillus clavatus NRRL 1]EAW15095.1 MFS transporter, putative [Aspergillus clavatus NRRL 1]
MVLTLQGRQTSSNDEFPTAQLFLLAICRVAEPIALTSIFPYSWVMVKDFRIANDTDASFYAGILVATFSLAEALTGMFWGGLSDRIGRKPVLLSGCFGTILSLLLVGLAPNFWVALLGRALGGLLNGNIGVIQTMVGELVKRPEHEPRAYAVMPFVWSIGTIIGPAIGGLLARPAETYPSLFSHSGLFGKFPYLLPNLVCSLLLLLSILGSWLFLQETHPDLQHRSTSGDSNNASAESPLLATSGATANAGADLRAESYGTFNQVQLQADEDWFVNADGSKYQSPKQPVFTWRVVSLVIALAIFTYHSMTYDHLLPIFLQDPNGSNVLSTRNSGLSFPGGLGLSTQTVGLIMSSDGIIALIIQSCIFPVLAQSLGVWRLFVIVTVLHPLAYLIVPFLMFLPQQFLLFGIYSCLIVRNILSIIDYPVLLILIKQASPSDSVTGKINGLAASAGAVSRTIAPPVAGFLYSAGAELNFTAVAWWASALVAVIGAAQLFFIDHNKHRSATIRSAVPCHCTPDEYPAQKETIHIIVTDTDADAEDAGLCHQQYSFWR